MLTVVTLALLLSSSTARAEDRLPSWAAPADHHGVQRGRGALLITLGAVSLTFGIALAGISGIVWEGYNPDCQFGCEANDRKLAAGVTHAFFTGAFVLGGAAMLAIGVQKYTTHKVPRVLLVPTASTMGGGAMLSGSF